MRKNNLASKGLSLSQAQSISNLCHQKAIEISRVLSSVNNFSKTIKIDGEVHTLQKAMRLNADVVGLLKEKAKLHATQAFLMENIKAKANILEEIKSEKADVSSVIFPEDPKFISPVNNTLESVDEEYGWEQLTAIELNEYRNAEAFSSHIGQYIHKGSILEGLRNELSNVPAIEWMEVEKNKKTPVSIKVHHTADELMGVHEELAKLHREYNQRVNYYKAKVKNIVTLRNSEIAKHNADIHNDAATKNNAMQLEFQTETKKANSEVESIRKEFEKERQKRINATAMLRIKVAPIFQETINEFLEKIPEEKE